MDDERVANDIYRMTEGSVELDLNKLTEEEIKEKYPWALTGRKRGTQHRIITSLDLDSNKMEEHNRHLQAKYRTIEENEVRYEEM